MSIILRRALFYLLLLMFLVASPLVIAYSSGWRLDTKTWKIMQTGAIFLEGYSNNSKFFLNGRELDSKKGLFQKGLLINNLLPGEYKIEIFDPNKNIWQKTLVVESTLVRGIRSIIIPPQESSSLKFWSEPVGDFFFNSYSDKNTFLWVSLKNEAFLSSLEKQNELDPNTQGELSKKNIKLIGDSIITTSHDGTKIVTSRNNKSYFITDVSTPESSLNLNTLLSQLNYNSKIVAVMAHPYNNFRWIIELESDLFVLDVHDLAIEKIGNPRGSKIIEKNSKIIWAENSSTLSNIFEYDPLLKNKRVIAENISHKINNVETTDSKIIFRSEDDNLYIFDKTTKTEELVALNVHLFATSPNGKKIAIKTDSEIIIYFLEDISGDEMNHAHNKIVLDISNLTKSDFVNLAWHKDSSHLFIEANKNILFTEIDAHTPQNYWTVVSQIKTWFYDEKNNALYFTKENILKKLQF